MKPQPPAESFHTYVQRIIDWTVRECNLQEWSIDFGIDLKLGEENDKGKSVAAKNEIKPNYLRSEITFGFCCVDYFKDAERDTALAHTIIHEVCHILTEQMYLYAYHRCRADEDHFVEAQREADTERIANIVYKRLPQSVWRVKRLKRRK
jgi:diphthamide synthase subunit DPH2